MSEGVYHHPPGKLSRWGVVDVGLKCPHSCKHCFYSYLDGSADQFSGMRHARWHKQENLFALIESLSRHDFLGFDVTGGEPTAHPSIIALVARASDLGIAPRIITLGQFLGVRDLLGRLLDAGIVDFRFSLHAVEPSMFHRMTGGDLSRLLGAMNALQRKGFHYVTNTTITEQNYQALPEIARWIAARPEIYQTTFLFFMPYYQWAGAHAGEHRVRYSEIARYLQEAVAIIEEAEIGCTIRYAPQCTIRGMEKNHAGIAGVRHDPHEWMNAIDHTADPERVSLEEMAAMGRPLAISERDQGVPLEQAEGEWLARRGSKVMPQTPCHLCRAISVCDGADPAYLGQFGTQELLPYAVFRGDVIDHDRRNYLPAYIMKLRPEADARGAVKAAFQRMREPNVALAVT